MCVGLQIGPFDKDRYLEQDLEPQRKAAVALSVNHERLWQEEMAQQKAEQEAKARIDWIHQEIDNRQRMRLYAEDVILFCPSKLVEWNRSFSFSKNRAKHFPKTSRIIVFACFPIYLGRASVAFETI